MNRSERLDPEVSALLAMMDAQGAPPLESQDPVEARNSRIEPMKMLGGEPPALGHVEDLSVPGPGGNVPVRMYASEPGGLRPVLIYFHGGGFVFGNLDTHDAVCRALAKESGAVVISVDYRLSPEHKFPAAVEDSHAVIVWVAANAERLGVDARRIAVGGDSAGGNLAIVIAMRCRDAGGPALAAQVLLYPLTDFSSFETGSHRELGEGYFLTRGAMDWFRGHYLAAAVSRPLMIAASHGQSRSTRLFTSTATTSPMFLLLAPSIGIERVLEVVRVRWIDPKRSAFYVLHRFNIHFGGEKITHRH